MLTNVTIRCAMDTQFSGFEIFAPKVEVAWTALHRQYAGAELDYLFVCLVNGLTSPAYEMRWGTSAV
jgi:hypothetical protein